MQLQQRSILTSQLARGAHHLPDDAQFRQHANYVSGQINFIPLPSVDSCSRSRVMVIVPAFAKRCQAEPPYIATFVFGVVRSLSPDMTDAVNAPGKVPQRQRARDRSPENPAPAGHGIAEDSGQEPRQGKQNALIQNSQPGIVAGNIRHKFTIVAALFRIMTHDPTHVGVQKTHQGGMRIAVLVSRLMMPAMYARPARWTTLQSGGAQPGKDPAQPGVALEAAVCE